MLLALPVPVLSLPTATHDLAETQETPDRPP
jgi:hypothetical protein